MGNQQSSHSHPTTPTTATATATSSPHSPNVTSAHAQSTASNNHHHHYDRPFGHPNPRRRESIQALSTAKASAAPPSESLESASSLRPRSRARTTSSTTAAVAHHLRAAAQDSLKSPSFEDKMGNEQSRHKAHAFHHDKSHSHSHSHSHSQPSQPLPPAFTPPKPKPVEEKHALAPSPQTRPVNVPAAPREDANTGASRTEAASSLEPADASQEGFIVPSSHYSRPPRLPLPIEEEPHTPGSPIIAPTDLASPIDHHEIEGAFPRRSSMLSSTTADDDDLGDEFKGPQGKETVPTIVEWEGPGERVYVTGTFAGWDRKYRLHANGPSKKKNALSAYVHITPGTHHLMFIVDNDMRTSDKLPTAVDYTNILVNYIEVVRDVKTQEPDIVADKKTDPVPAQLPRPADGYRPSHVVPTTDIQPIPAPLPEPKPKVQPPSPKKYHSEIPRYLLDLDAPEESRRFARANAAAGVLPNPPSLPMFLNKSILNGVTPMKDDSSVLIMPNHTVLNHLATSSIKDNILATSATTRYKQKFLTTIMYKPRAEEAGAQ
ncbi:carbohydrate-binding module family 48 protein [Periconia macrospinosa]|uniref:Carbohydrate-binding module family 48 protein n=1 Tax=Periconia macrospinosa TaxID=97972 RepID=A0A2V1EAV1_9PLEO|nr:carbohydrate-binding module family 48 protein [Periconia macrospinosa]